MKIKKWGRFFAVFDENDALVCVTVYKKGAAEVVRREAMASAARRSVDKTNREIARIEAKGGAALIL